MAEANRCDQCHEFQGSCLCYGNPETVGGTLNGEGDCEPCMCGDPMCAYCGPLQGYPPPCRKCGELECGCAMPLDPDDIANLPGAPDPWEQAHEAWNMEEARGEMAEGGD